MTYIELEEAHVWECNGCGKIAAFPPSDFRARVDELHQRGWAFRLDEETGHEGYGRTWRHFCQKCRRERQQTSIWDQPLRSVKGSSE